MDKKEKQAIRSISLRTILPIVFFFLALIVFAWLTHEIVSEDETWFDNKAFHFFKEHSSPGMIRFFKNLTFFGSPYFLLPTYVLIITWLLIIKRKNDAIDIFIIAATGTMLTDGLKLIIGRVRPDLPLFEALTNYSFPSGHALSSFIFCSVLIWLTRKGNWPRPPWKYIIYALLILLSLLIGISRIVLRYHYASDVLAGFCLGFVWVFLSLWVQRKVRKAQKA